MWLVYFPIYLGQNVQHEYQNGTIPEASQINNCIYCDRECHFRYVYKYSVSKSHQENNAYLFSSLCATIDRNVNQIDGCGLIQFEKFAILADEDQISVFCVRRPPIFTHIQKCISNIYILGFHYPRWGTKEQHQRRTYCILSPVIYVCPLCFCLHSYLYLAI